MEAKDYLELSPTQILKKKFKKTRTELANNANASLEEFAKFVMKKEPVYDCLDGIKKIQNSWYGKHADYRLTELMEEFKVELLNQN